MSQGDDKGEYIGAKQSHRRREREKRTHNGRIAEIGTVRRRTERT